jgi:hypothetical protein
MYALALTATSSEFANMLQKGVAGLTKRDIQLIVDGGYNTVESVAYTPRRVLEQIKGISEQKAGKILAEGKTVWIFPKSGGSFMLTLST